MTAAPTSVGSSRSWLPALTRIAVCVAAGYAAVGATVPVLPGYVTGRLHGTAAAVGWIMGGYAITAVVFRPLFASLVPRWGSRAVMLVGTGLIALASLGYLVAPTLAVLLTFRLLLGAGIAALLAAATVWVVALAPPQQQGWAAGLVGTINYVVLGSCAPLGSWLAGQAGPRAVWVLAGLVPLAGAVALRHAPAPPVPSDRGTDADHVEGRARRAVRTARGVLLPGAALALSAFGYSLVISFSGAVLAAHGVVGSTVVITAFAASMVVVRLTSFRLRVSTTSVPALALLFGTELVGITVLAFATTLWTAVVAGALIGSGMSLIYPALSAIVIRGTRDARQKAAAVGSYGAFVNVGISGGNILLGGVAALSGYPTAVAACAGALLLGWVCAALSTRRAAAAPGSAGEPSRTR